MEGGIFMTLKCGKIRGVDKSICTCEQKIAYNYAFSWMDAYQRRTKGLSNVADKMVVFQDIIDFIIKDIKSKKEMQKYNIDAIIIAFRNGFLTYCENFFIASEYSEIGKVFKIPYEII